jgi:hypothetical protein
MFDFGMIEDSLTFISISFVIILCLALQLTTFFLFLNKTKNKESLYASILFVLNINILMQMTLPLIMSAFFSFSIENDYGISLFGIFKVVLLQIVYTCIFLIVFLYGKNSNRYDLFLNKSRRKNFVILDSFDYKCFVFILMGGYLLATSLSVGGIVQSVAEIAGEVQKDNSLLDLVTIYLRTMFEWTALVTAVLFLFTSNGSKLIRISVMIFCIGVVLRQLALGLRGGVFIMSILVLFISYIKTNKINFRFVIPAVVLLIPVFSFLGGSFRENITSGFLVEAEMFERLKIIATRMFNSEKNINKEEKSFSESIYSRLEATRNSVSLIEAYDNGFGVGFKPLLSSVTALVPQQVTGVKKYAASSTDNAFGTAMYFVREKTYGFTDMGPFLTSGHEYWEGGPFYLVFSAFLVGMIWRKVTSWCVSRGNDTMSLIILISLLDAHHGEMSVLSPLALVVRLFYFQILPVFILLHFISYVDRYNKKIFHYKKLS